MTRNYKYFWFNESLKQIYGALDIVMDANDSRFRAVWALWNVNAIIEQFWYILMMLQDGQEGEQTTRGRAFAFGIFVFVRLLRAAIYLLVVATLYKYKYIYCIYIFLFIHGTTASSYLFCTSLFFCFGSPIFFFLLPLLK